MLLPGRACATHGRKGRTMTKDKDIKRRIRARMEKTGESYTTARSHLLRSRSLPLPDNYEKLTGKTDEVMLVRTGRAWPDAETMKEQWASHLPSPRCSTDHAPFVTTAGSGSRRISDAAMEPPMSAATTS